MKKLISALFVLLFFLPSSGQSQPFFDKLLERLGPRLHPGDLRVLQLEFTPDPVWERQRLVFRATISNLSQYPGRVSFFIKDRDEIVTSLLDVMIRPGYNRIDFPQTTYRFSRYEHCFTVEADIERTRRPIDVVREFCARRTVQGWTLTEMRVGPLLVEDMEIFPDPFRPGQDFRFRVRLRNDGPPLRGSLRIQDRDQTITHLNEVNIPHGYAEYHFPHTRYSFQRHDHCFTVFVEMERASYRAEAVREFCAKSLGWTLKP